MKWIKVLKAGTFKDSSGTTHTFDEERLDRIVKNYNEQPEEARRQAPHVLGHPKSDDPAMGWVSELKRVGDAVFAGSSDDDFVPEFVDAVNKGHYRYRSVSLYPNDLLRHVGWLGAAQPAVPGLGAANLSEEDDSITINLMDQHTAWHHQSIGGLFQSLRDWIIEQFGLEKADRVLSQWQIDDLKAAKADEEEVNHYSRDYNEPNEEDMDKIKELQEKLDKATADFSEATAAKDTLTAERDQLRTDLAARDERIKTLEAEVASKESAAKKAEFEAYCDKLIEDGRMLPNERDYFVDELTAKASVTGEFAEGQSPLENLKAMLEARASHGLFKEIATKGTSNPATEVELPAFAQGDNVDEGRREQYVKIKKVQKEQGISFEEAFDIVTKESL